MKFGGAINLGLNFAIGFTLLTIIGHKIDEKRGGGSVFTLSGIFLGLIYGAYETWKVVRIKDLNNRNHENDHT